MYDTPIQKTVMLMVLTNFDDIYGQMRPLWQQGGLGQKFEYRDRHITKWMQGCWDFIRNIDKGAKPIAAPAMKAVVGFSQAFVREWTNMEKVYDPAWNVTSEFMQCCMLSEAANVLLYDLNAYCLLARKQKCWRWLRHHSSALNEHGFRTMCQEAKDYSEHTATELYLKLADYLKPENHRQVY